MHWYHCGHSARNSAPSLASSLKAPLRVCKKHLLNDFKSWTLPTFSPGASDKEGDLADWLVSSLCAHVAVLPDRHWLTSPVWCCYQSLNHREAIAQRVWLLIRASASTQVKGVEELESRLPQPHPQGVRFSLCVGPALTPASTPQMATDRSCDNTGQGFWIILLVIVSNIGVFGFFVFCFFSSST